MSGNMLESKKAKFDIWRTENNVIVPDVRFSLSLNHSRLLSSSLEWRTDLKDNIVVSEIVRQGMYTGTIILDWAISIKRNMFKSIRVDLFIIKINNFKILTSVFKGVN